MSKIPPVDLARQYRTISEEVGIAVLDVLGSGRYIGGETVSEFERQFARYHGTSDCVSCNSGTDALYLALRALGIGPGDEVITSPFTFIATAETITMVGATPVFVDIDLDTFNLDVTKIEAAITANTKAIVPVHLFGQSVNMSAVMEIARSRGLFVIEDCAQATGAEWDGQKVGSIGDIGCFSFFPTKNLGGCGDGGAIATNNPELAALIRMIKEHGSKVRYVHEAIGVNSRLDAIQAAILQIKLKYLDLWNDRRAEVARRYDELLQPLPNITLPSALVGGKHVWNQYTILVENRDRVREGLLERDAISMVYYPIPLHLQPVYQSLGYRKGQFPVSELAAEKVLSLPMFPDLTLEEQQQVTLALKDCLE
ncbi:DegT/DnrJ/EryC1/StrS family aminotransferase [Pannus brasiliensis CCIBt3594]|uniref:DegT/DnrJ/EryC1/StrS family aminotransferase n=1 Tax=Pannus brasiliensis CCIBt3594 TaxID=1427578 RepID=A0AAW9QUB7_9CHRO